MRNLPILLASFGVALLLAACGEPPDTLMEKTYDPFQTLVVEIGPNAGETQILAVDDAIAMWNEAAGTRLTREPVEGAQVVHVRYEHAAPAFRGIYRDEKGDIVLNLALSERGKLAIVTAHEFGHAFGLWHVDVNRRTSLMNKGNLEVHPTPEDVEALRDRWPSFLE